MNLLERRCPNQGGGPIPDFAQFCIGVEKICLIRTESPVASWHEFIRVRCKKNFKLLSHTREEWQKGTSRTQGGLGAGASQETPIKDLGFYVHMGIARMNEALSKIQNPVPIAHVPLKFPNPKAIPSGWNQGLKGGGRSPTISTPLAPMEVSFA